MKWCLFLPQLPASPSTLRVTVWRRLRAIGALSLQNGVWVLPATPESHQRLDDVRAYIQAQGSLSYTFDVVALEPGVENTLLAGFRAERGEEYAEFSERCQALLSELKRETVGKKFTYAELEEAERDLHKLASWLDTIRARDVASGGQRTSAQRKLEQCRQACRTFAERVYARQGIAPGGRTLRRAVKP